MNGTFVNDPTCGGTCIVLPTKYNCVNGVCQGPFATGQYNSLAECQAACVITPTKYNCVSGQCQGPYTTGQYNSYADCVTACTTTQYHLGCNSTTKKCEQKTGGGGNTDGCTSVGQTCSTGGGVQCSSGQMNIFGTCYKTSDIVVTAGAIVLLMMLTRK